MKKYRFVEDLTSDVMFDSYGKNEKELFENSAEALFAVMCDLKKVKAAKKKIVTAKGKDLKELMFNWLQQLIALVDVESMFFSKFKVVSITNKQIKAEVYGSEIKPELGETVVKAVTRYNFELIKEKNGLRARVALDI